MNYTLQGDDIGQSILSLLETGLEVGGTIYTQYKSAKVAEKNATTASELAAAQNRIAELEARAKEEIVKESGEGLDNVTKWVTIGGIGLVGILTLVSLR